ncbi:ATP-binding cassette subfamily B protein [Mucilaginibacter yixingensis]|uniref:ATP-binding cassette subfamily B protein n=1 Tax=Mucilaginibacter yixingensis TaxID=1295612 RepID=A0A2T5JH50_9SPHI|nr:ABC transporter ATP-binding protein [Mucilaginibacter yixingensis]PTR01696.1 ATP-binding cassette subfamily B protein [Mucilaginibacter yixingensis]
MAKRNTINNITMKDRLRALRNLPAFFKLVWQSGPGMMLANILLRFAKAAIPFLLLLVGKLIIDQVLQLNRNHSSFAEVHLWKLVGVEFVLAILSDGLSRAITLMDSLLGDLFANHTSVRIMEHAATLDLDQFEDAVFYDKLERARQQTVGRTVLLSQVMSQIQDLITIGFLAAGLVVFNPWLILLLVIAILPAFLGESYFNDETYALSRSQTPHRRELDYLRYIGASDETAKEIKMFSLSGFIVDRFKTLSDKFYVDNKRISVKRSLWGTLFALLGSVGYYGAYVFIIQQTVKGALTIGELTFLAGSFRQLRTLLESILGRFTTVSQGAIYLSDFFEFFEIEPQIHNTNQPRPFPNPIKQGFTFENVGFRYLNSERWANRNLNFTLRPAEKLALVGENGAGKSTLVKLLARLYDPTEGRILLDGYDLREYDLNDLRQHIGIIFQDFLRYQMTFSQNIAAGNIDQKTNEELIKRSARQSLADELAKKLPAGYNQMLGKRFSDGVELSGGEWQKVAIARAYMRDAQLIILDEPTSALDARAEFQVFERFTELTRGKMAVLISHRFSTVRMADRIVVLDKGEIAEIGSHQELLAHGGRYAELFQLQAAGYQ